MISLGWLPSKVEDRPGTQCARAVFFFLTIRSTRLPQLCHNYFRLVRMRREIMRLKKISEMLPECEVKERMNVVFKEFEKRD